MTMVMTVSRVLEPKLTTVVQQDFILEIEVTYE